MALPKMNPLTTDFYTFVNDNKHHDVVGTSSVGIVWFPNLDDYYDGPSSTLQPLIGAAGVRVPVLINASPLAGGAN